VNKSHLDVLFVISSLDRGGSERQMINLAAGLIGLGHRAKIGTLVKPGSLAEEAQGRGIPVIDFSGGAGSLPRGLLGFRRFVKAERPDVIHPYLPRDNALVSLLRPLLRPSKVVWGVRASDVDLTKYSPTTRLLWPFVVKMSRRADLLITNSEAGAEYHVAEGYPSDRMHVVYNGIDTNNFDHHPLAGQSFRRNLGIELDTPLLGLIGRFDPMKGHDRLADIVARIRSHIPDVHVVAVGSHTSDQSFELQRSFQRNGVPGCLTLVAEVADPADAFNACDVVLLPSYSEGFPNVLAEALACGTPTVAFDVGDAEAISAGLCPVVDQNDIEAFASAVVEMINHPPDSESLRRHIQANFSLEQLASRTADLLEQLFVNQGK
jgi:glycosyltransferase involved in cell wall biosynthesis